MKFLKRFLDVSCRVDPTGDGEPEFPEFYTDVQLNAAYGVVYGITAEVRARALEVFRIATAPTLLFFARMFLWRVEEVFWYRRVCRRIGCNCAERSG